ncbi:MAG: cupin domain-containing protein [Rhodospirillales bacterium]
MAASAFSCVLARDSAFDRPGFRPQFAYRDLGVAAATGGAVDAYIMRAVQPCTAPFGLHRHDLGFELLFLLKGRLDLYFEGAGRFATTAGTAIYQPPMIAHDVEGWSNDLELLEIIAPADFRTDALKPDEAPRTGIDGIPRLSIVGTGQSVYTRDGLRPQFAYRDLGVRAATGGAWQAHLLRATGAGTAPIGMHRHALDFQMVYVMSGWVRFFYEGHGEMTLGPGDCVNQPPGIAHDVLAWSADLELFELTAPAEFATAAA